MLGSLHALVPVVHGDRAAERELAFPFGSSVNPASSMRRTKLSLMLPQLTNGIRFVLHQRSLFEALAALVRCIALV